VLYFYPKASTPGCTQEGLDFTRRRRRLRGAQHRHPRRLTRRHQGAGELQGQAGLRFDLLSDKDETLCKAFDVIKLKKMYGKESLGVERSTFLIDEHGVLRQEWRGVKVKGHVDEVLAAVRASAECFGAGSETAASPPRAGGVIAAPMFDRTHAARDFPKRRAVALMTPIRQATAPARAIKPMIKRESDKPCLFVLDTNVLMHDPTAIFRFKEHDIFLPMVVLEELDAGKKGMSEVARNVRQVSRFLDQLMTDADKDEIDAGLPIHALSEYGRGFTEPPTRAPVLPDRTRCRPAPSAGGRCPARPADNDILATAGRCRHAMAPTHTVVIVSKDINLRIKAAVLGIPAEDYSNDQVLDDVDLLYTGMDALAADFWEHHAKEVDSWKEEGRTFYRIKGPDVADWYPNQCLFWTTTSFEAMVREKRAARPRRHRTGRTTTARRATTSGASRRATASRTSR
jgi:peroxiredoxin